MNGDGAPYWRNHYGIGRRWTPSRAGRRGLVIGLAAAFGLLVVAAAVGLLAG